MADNPPIPPSAPFNASVAEVAAIESEPPIFTGPVSLWMGWKAIALSFVCDIVGVLALIYGSLLSSSSRNVFLIGGAALLISSALMLAYTVARIKSLRYRITRRLIERENGMILKRIDSIDLARIKDVELTQSLVDR